MRIETIDLEFQGTRHVIAAFLVFGPKGPVLIEPGPGSTLPVLLRGLERHGLGPGDVPDVLATHIHLDHAGSAGWWAQQGARVHVHPLGAPHVVDPSRLLASATRIYGDRMGPLWGDVLPAPAERVRAVGDGDVVEAGGLSIVALDTPGHARHHHAFRVESVAFAGDAAGIRLPGQQWIDLPAPPPEFDLVAWKRSLDRMRGLGVSTLYRTHFGAASDVGRELDRFEDLLDRAVRWIAELRDAGLGRGQMVREFSGRMRKLAVACAADAAAMTAYELANPRSMTIDGIARYLQRRGPD